MLSILGSVVGAGPQLVSSGLSLVGSLVGTLAGYVRGLLGVVGGLLRVGFNMLSFVATLPGLLLSGAKSLLGFLGNVASGLVNGLIEVGTVVGGLAVGALVGFGKAIAAAAKSALEFARSTAQLAATTGLGYASAAGVQRRFGAVGVGADAVNGAFGGQNADVFRMKAAAFGLPGFDSNTFIDEFARKFQSLNAQGTNGQLQAQGMLQALGLDNPQFAALANMDPGKLAANQQFAGGVQQSLGLNDASTARYAQDVPLVLAKIGTVFENLKIKLATSFLPIIESVLNGIAKIGGDSVGGIGKFIDDAAEWVFVKAPLIAMNGVVAVTGAVQSVVDAAIKKGQELAAGLPVWLGNAVAFITDMLIALNQKISEFGPKFISGIAKVLVGVSGLIAGWMRSLADGINTFATGQGPFYGVLDMVAQGVDALSDLFVETAAVFAFLGAAIKTMLATMPSTWLYNKLGITDIQAEDPMTAYNAVKSSMKPSSLSLSLSQSMNPVAVGKFTKGITDGADNIEKGGADAAAKWTTEATEGLNTVIRGLKATIDHLSPRDANGKPLPNQGEVKGQYLAGHINAVVGVLRDTVKPLADSAAAMALSYQKKLGTEKERDARWQELMLANAQEQTRLMRQDQQAGRSNDRTDRALGYAFVAYSGARAAALRAGG